MAHSQFEALATLLRRLGSRRDMVQRGCFSGALAALSPRPHDDALAKKKKKRKGKKRCKRGQVRCGKKCADLESSKKHCGRCGQRCRGGLSCANGACSCQQGPCLVAMLIPDQEPVGVAVLPNGNLAITRDYDNQLLILTPDGDVRDVIGEFGTGPGEFNEPEGIAVDSDGAIFVADQYNDRIQTIATDGNIEVWSLDGRPLGIAIADSDAVYATVDEQVRRLTSEGQTEYAWGPGGDEETEFSFGSNVAVDGAGRVYVADAQNNRVYRFTDNGAGAIQQDWAVGSPGADPGEFDSPWGIAVDAGRVFIADYWNDRVQVLSADDGSFLFAWPVRSFDGDPIGPDGIAIGTDGRIYVGSFWGLLVYELGPGL